MSNTTGQINLVVLVINHKNVKEKLIELISIDSDYQDVAEEIANTIIFKHDTLTKMIKAAIKFEKHKEVESRFILNNDTYCSGYEYEITKVDRSVVPSQEEVVLSLAYES
jgi:hypothetical protein